MQISFTKEIFIASPALNCNGRLIDKWLVAGLIFTEVHSLVNIVTSKPVCCVATDQLLGLSTVQSSISLHNLAGRRFTLSRPACNSRLCESNEART